MDPATVAFATAFTPPLSILVFLCIVVAIVLLKLDGKSILGLLDSKAALLLLATVLFALVLVTHLFQRVDWTADLLKVLAGVLVGAASGLGKKEGAADAGSKPQQAIDGSGNVQAGRDVIGEMKGDIASLRDSIVNQTQTIHQIAEHTHSESEPRIRTRFHVQLTPSDTAFVDELKERQRGKADFDAWRDWIQPCLSQRDVVRGLEKELERIQHDGWRPERIDYDNHNSGLFIQIEASKLLSDV
jgi:hypothetical protein